MGLELMIPRATCSTDWANQVPPFLVFIYFTIYFNCFKNKALSYLSTRHGARTHDFEIKSCTLYRPGHPGASYFCFKSTLLSSYCAR